MKISFYTCNDYEKLIPLELIKRSYDIEMEECSKDTEIVFCMSMEPYYRFKNENPKFKGIVIQNVLDLPFWRLNSPNWKDFYQRYRESLEECDYVVTISQFTSNQLKQYWQLKSTPLFSVFNNKIVEKIPKQEKENQVVTAGRFTFYKRFDLVIQALSQMDDPPLYKIIGRGLEESIYRKLCDNYKVKYEMLIWPTHEEVITEIKKSKLCIMPSEFEGLGMVPKEAIWGDTPSIVADIPTLKEFHSDNIIYHELGNVADLQSKIEENLNKKINLTKAKKQIEPLTIENCTDRVIKFIEKINKDKK